MVATLSKPKKKKPLPDLSKPSALMQAGENHPANDIILVFAGQIIEARAEIDDKRSVLKKIRQQATNAGIKVEELDEAIKLGEQGIETVVSRFQRLIHYAKALGTPIGQQLQLFATEPAAISHETLLQGAFDQGRILALLGKDPDEQKYQPSSDLGQEHLRGWNDGQKFRMEQFVRNSENVQAEAKRALEEAAKKKTEADAKAAKKAKSGKGKAEAAVRETMAKLDDEPVPEEEQADSVH